MKLLLLPVIAVLMSSCAMNAHIPAAVSMTQGHVTTTLARGAVKKTGKACTKNVLALYSWGDASIDAARKNAGIKKVAYIDNSYFNVLGIYQEYCTLVRGK